MLIKDLERHVDQLRKKCDAIGLEKRLLMRPQVLKLMRSVEALGKRVPPKLKELANRLEDDAYDDMFDNMPV